MKVTIIQQKIFEIKGQKVMLDFDLAELYKVETKMLKRAVRRNINRFPKDFMFVLTNKEWENLRHQFGTSSWGGLRYLPFAFTEHGITMLASVLNSDRAIKMNIAIVRAFVALKQIAIQHKDLAERLEELRKELHERIGEHDTQLAGIYNAIENLLDEKAEQKTWKEREKIGFKKE
jgi:phage regulator Rha-like protein